MYVYRANLAVPCDSCWCQSGEKKATIKIGFDRKTCGGYDFLTFLCDDCAKELRDKLQEIESKEEVKE